MGQAGRLARKGLNGSLGLREGGCHGQSALRTHGAGAASRTVAGPQPGPLTGAEEAIMIETE